MSGYKKFETGIDKKAGRPSTLKDTVAFHYFIGPRKGRIYFWICKTHPGRGVPGGQGVGRPPPSKDTVFANAVVSRTETAEHRPRSDSAASAILIFITPPVFDFDATWHLPMGYYLVYF